MFLAEYTHTWLIMRQAAKPQLPSFWVPSLTPSIDKSSMPSKASRTHPICPASAEDSPHDLSLKSLIPVTFSMATSSKSSNEASPSSKPGRICPACKKGLGNGTKAMLTIPCGHVICKPCTEWFMKPAKGPDPHAAANGEPMEEDLVRCYVCEQDLGSRGSKKPKAGKDGKTSERESRPGLVELSSEGTGFASSGKSVTKREGVVFQC